MTLDGRITSVDAIPDDTTFLFRVRDLDSGNVREAILLRIDGEVVGWLNYCQHFMHIKLDKGSGAPMRGDEIVCTNHGAMFEADSGLCTFGPCEGAYLEEIEITVRDEEVFLVDEGYEFVGTGPMDDEDNRDLTSTSNVEF